MFSKWCRMARSGAMLGVIAGATVGWSPALAAVRDEAPTIGLIEIEHELSEREAPLASIFGSDGHPTLRRMIGIIDDAAADSDLDGLVIRLRDAALGSTQVEELAGAIKRCREAGKKVHIFADSYGTAELMLAAHCDEVLLQSGGDVTMPGLYMEEMYLADTFNWVGIQPDFVQVGDYKGASEPMARSSPSPQWEQNISQLLDGMYGNIREHVKTGRKIDDAQLDRAMEQAVMASGEVAKNTKLVDEVIDLPMLSKHLEKTYGGEVEWANLTESDDEPAPDMQNPFTLFAKLMKAPSHRPKRDTIAVLHINGPIVDGESTSGGFMGEESVGSYTIRRALQEIEDNDKIKGLVIRVNSPGGSAVASESMWLGVRRVSEHKPVWVSVGSMAASGGYYVAVSGSKIYVNPSSIVGSIGVVGGKLALGGLYEKVKLNVVPRSRGPMGGLLGSTRVWSEAERSLIRTRMTETYDLFTRRVTAGREGIDLSKTAEGRLFVGSAAINNKMADKIGGLTDTITDLAVQLSLEEGAYDVLDYPAPQGLGEILESMFGSMASAKVNGAASSNPLAGIAAAIREIVGPKAWPALRDQMSALLQLRKENVLLTSPRAVIFK